MKMQIEYIYSSKNTDRICWFHTTGNGLCDTPEVYETAELFYIDNYFKINIITYLNTGLVYCKIRWNK